MRDNKNGDTWLLYELEHKKKIELDIMWALANNKPVGEKSIVEINDCVYELINYATVFQCLHI